MADYINVTSLNRLAKRVLEQCDPAERSDRLWGDFRLYAALQERASVFHAQG